METTNTVPKEYEDNDAYYEYHQACERENIFG